MIQACDDSAFCHHAPTRGNLLGGRVSYAQPARGFRSGIEPVLLAAAIPARPGERILEGGSGAGAALLCLAARVGQVQGVGIEQDPALASIGAAVHFLDIGGIPAPDAAGLETILKGLQEKSRNDDETLREAMKILDLMYGGYAKSAG